MQALLTIVVPCSLGYASFRPRRVRHLAGCVQAPVASRGCVVMGIRECEIGNDLLPCQGSDVRFVALHIQEEVLVHVPSRQCDRHTCGQVQ